MAGDTAASRVVSGSGARDSGESFRAHPTLDVGIVLTVQDINRTLIRILTSRDARVGSRP